MINRCLAIRASSIIVYTVVITTQHSFSVATTTHFSKNMPSWGRPTSSNKTISNISNSCVSTIDEKANTQMLTGVHKLWLCHKGVKATQAVSAKACNTKTRLKAIQTRLLVLQIAICRCNSRVNNKTDSKCRTAWVSSRINILGRQMKRVTCYWIRWISTNQSTAFSYPRRKRG